MAPISQSIKPASSSHGAKAAASVEVREAMEAYANAHQVNEMLRLLLTRLLEVQPLDPIEFLLESVRNSEQLDALEKQCEARRFDLRREKTKRALVEQAFKRLLALQARWKHRDAMVADGQHLVRDFLLEQLQDHETRSDLRQHFPLHYRDLIRWFSDNRAKLPAAMSWAEFSAASLAVLASKSSD